MSIQEKHIFKCEKYLDSILFFSSSLFPPFQEVSIDTKVWTQGCAALSIKVLSDRSFSLSFKVWEVVSWHPDENEFLFSPPRRDATQFSKYDFASVLFLSVCFTVCSLIRMGIGL